MFSWIWLKTKINKDFANRQITIFRSNFGGAGNLYCRRRYRRRKKKTIPELLLEAISIPRHPEVITVKINRISEHPKLTQAHFIPHQ
jgi:hypothetical protein